MRRTFVHEMKTDKRYRLSVFGYIILTVGMCLGLYYLSQVANDAHKNADQTKRALCLQKANANRQVQDLKAYIESDTDGFVFGIPVSVLHRSLKVNQQTLKSLSDVQCPSDGKP